MRYQSNRPKRQFLAGVSCPKCEKIDVIVQVQIFEPEADEYIECTQCGHIERRPEADGIKEKNRLDTQQIKDAMQKGTSGTVKFIH